MNLCWFKDLCLPGHRAEMNTVKNSIMFTEVTQDSYHKFKSSFNQKPFERYKHRHTYTPTASQESQAKEIERSLRSVHPEKQICHCTRGSGSKSRRQNLPLYTVWLDLFLFSPLHVPLLSFNTHTHTYITGAFFFPLLFPDFPFLTQMRSLHWFHSSC